MTLEELQAKYDEQQKELEAAKKGQLDEEARKRLDYLEGEHKTLIEARDKAKDEKRKAEEERLKEQGEFKTLAEQRASELEEKEKALAEKDEVLKSYRERDEKEFSELLEKVPEELRGDLSEDLPLATRLNLARKLAAVKPDNPDYRGVGEAGGKQKRGEMTPAERAGYIDKHGRDAYLKLPQ
jgi:hypothetical protein